MSDKNHRRAALVLAGGAITGDWQRKGSYESPLSESPFGKWSMIMVVRHPTGDPADMKHMEPALSAGIPKKQ